VLAATGLTGATYLHISVNLTISEAKRHAVDIARALAIAGAQEVKQENRQRLIEIAGNFMSGGDLAYVIFTDMGGKVISSYQKGAGNIDPLYVDDGKHISVTPLNVPRVVQQEGHGSRVDVIYPITAGAVWDIKTPSPTIGYVRLGLNMGTAAARLERLRRDVVWLAVGIALLMVPIGFEVVRCVVGPINKLADAARAFARGELGARVQVSGWGEIADLKRAFNSMADQLATSHTELLQLNAELEDRVRQRTQDLEKANVRLSEMATHDSLTGLYNRRHFNEVLNRLYAEASRYNTDLTCMMVDVDNFKLVNDGLGHHAGDQLLQLTTEVLVACIRETDVAVRFGGDEFAVLFPHSSPQDAAACAERILSMFRSELTRRLPEASFASLSIGLASRERDLPKTSMELVRQADEALYMAKASGKNRVKVKIPAMPPLEA
jgi:diguanylate cyclase (GGDEF)-like protein